MDFSSCAYVDDGGHIRMQVLHVHMYIITMYIHTYHNHVSS